MMVGIDEAAAAFDRDTGLSDPPSKALGPKKDITEGPPERMFESVGELEVDEESPPKGGGDDEEVPPPRTKEDVDGDGDEDEEDVDAEGEEDTEDEDEGDETPDEDEKFYATEVNVMVDGKEKTVTVKEALEGYIRTETFHQRMNDVEEAKKIIRATANDAVKHYEYATTLAQEIQTYMDGLVPAEPDWDAEFKKDPNRARELQKYFEGIKGFKAQLDEKVSTARAAAVEAQRTQLAAFAEAESAKFNQMNAKLWGTDPKRKSRDLQAMRRTALAQGFSEQEIAGVLDSRMLAVLLKASRYDRMMAAKPKPVREGAPLGKKPNGQGGPARRKPGAKNFSAAMKQLNKTGHVEDAALVFDGIMAREKRT